MTCVLKFELPLPDCVVMMPAGARVVSAGVQDSGLVVWAECATSRSDMYGKARRFVSVATGQDLPAVPLQQEPWQWKFVATVVTASGIVWHVYELALEV